MGFVVKYTNKIALNTTNKIARGKFKSNTISDKCKHNLKVHNYKI
jgi:hypothetical protein